MPIVNGYVTLPQYKAEWVNLDDNLDDLKIERAITAASRAIDHFCHRQFWQDTGSRLFDAEEPWLLDIDDVSTVTAVATDTDTDGIFETVWVAGDYQLLPLNPTAAPEQEPYTQISAVGTRRFPVRPPTGRAGLIQVTGTWGWNAIPSSVEQACLLTVNRLVKRPGSPEGVTGFDEFGVIRISSRDDPDAVRLLTPYVKTLVFA